MASASGSAAARHREQLKAASGLKPGYKVVMEETLQPKKKLMISVCAKQVGLVKLTDKSRATLSRSLLLAIPLLPQAILN